MRLTIHWEIAGVAATMCPHLAPCLLPAADQLSLDRVDVHDDAVCVIATLTTPTAACPGCGTVARRVHSRYCRRVADLPWAGRPVTLHLRVRRFFCPSPSCPRMTFAERLPDLAPRYART